MIRPLPVGYNVGDIWYCYFPSYDSNGKSITITGLAVTDVEIYKDGGTTQRASDNGYTLLDTDGIDFDGSVGLHGLKIDSSDNSDAGFYADGSHYLIWVDAITCDGQTVRFGWELLPGRVLRPTTAGRKLDVEAGGCAGIDWANVANPTTAVDLSETDIQLCDTVTTNTDMVGTDGANTTVPDAAGTAAGLHTTTDAAIAALNDFDPANDAVANVTLVGTCTTNTDMVGTDGANTTVPDAAGTAAGLHATTDAAIAALENLSAAEAEAACDAALATYDAPTKAELDAAIELLKRVRPHGS